MADEKASDDGRILRLSTPLGKDFFLMESLEAREAISSIYTVSVNVLHEEDPRKPGTPHEVKPEDILGKQVTIELNQSDGTIRYFNGIVSRFRQGHRTLQFTHYSLDVVPQFWMLTMSKQSRIFQDKDVKQILETVLSEKGIDFKIQTEREYQPRNYCVQYRETDFDFASRMMEEEGIYYYFEHTAEKHTMIIGDTQESHKDCPSKSSIEFVVRTDEKILGSVIRKWVLDYLLQTGKIERRDYHFQLPTTPFLVQEASRHTAFGNQEVEHYDWPGEYAQRFDGINRSGGDQQAKFQKIYQDSAQVGKSAKDTLDAKHKTFIGQSNCASFTAGHVAKIDKLPIKDQNGQYVFLSVTHSCDQSPDHVSNNEVNEAYVNDFECIPVKKAEFATFRPQKVTPKPTVYGPMTATVVGRAGEEIDTDKYGRIKVQFHWDRDGKNDLDSSCWLRVATSIAGNKYGTMYIPRIGQEVLVAFEHGDPDQPIVIGSVRNPQTMPRYELPKYKTITHICTKTSPDDGKGFNELRFEDRANKEQVFVHSQKRMDVRVRKDYYETNGGTRQESIGGSNARTTGGTLDLHIKDATFIGIDGKLNEAVKGEVVEDYQSSQFTKVATKHSLNAKEIILEATTKISLKVGGSCIVIEPSLITIASAMVKINSGGFGTETGDTSIDDPLDAGGADTGEPGYLDRPRTGGGRGRNRRTLQSQHYVYPPRPGESAAFTAMRNRLNTSAQGRHALEVFERNGVAVTNNPGGTAYSGNPTNSVNLDPARAGDAAPGFVHEMGHAEADHGGTSADVQAQTRADYIDTQLREDAAAERRAYEAEEQMNAAGGSERYNSSTRANYVAARDAERARLRAAEPGISDEELNRRSNDAGEAAILQDYRNGNVNTGNTTPPQSYVNYWGSDYDARHRP